MDDSRDEYPIAEWVEMNMANIQRPIDANYRLNKFVKSLETDTNELISIYEEDTIIGESIFNAFRDVVNAVNDGVGIANANELMRKLASTKSKLDKNENHPTPNDEELESFIQQVNSVCDTLVSMYSTSARPAYHIHDLLCLVLFHTCCAGVHASAEIEERDICFTA